VLRNLRKWLSSREISGPKVDPGSFLALVLGFLLGRTAFADSLSPFGPAFYAGTRTLGGSIGVFAGLGALAGSATNGEWTVLGYHALAIILSALLIKPELNGHYPRTLDSLVAGSIVAVSRGIVNTIDSPTLYAYVFALLEGLCAVIIAYLSRSAFSNASDMSPAQKVRSSESLLVLILLAVGGLRGVRVYGVSAATVAVMSCTLIAGYAAGPGPGAVSGLAGGLVVSLTGIEDPGIIGILGASGVLAGIGGWFGRIEAVLGYLSAGLLMSLYTHPSAPLTSAQRLFTQVIAAVPVFLVNSRVSRVISQRFPVLSPLRRSEKSRHDIEPLRLKMAAVSHALTEMGDMLGQAASAGEALPQPREVSGLTPAQTAVPLRQVAERVCRDCERRSACWEEEFGDTYEAFSSFIRQISISGHVSSENDGSGLSDRCVRFPEVVAEMNHHREIERLSARISTMDRENKETLAFQYKCLGRLLASRPVPDDEDPRRSSRPRLKVIVKGETVPATGGESAGDAWVRYDLDRRRVLTVLVDGMGKGEKAAKQSKDTLGILKALLDCGLDYDSCVSFLNSTLFLAGTPDSFVAVDCLLIDQETERAYFHKLGAPPSFIRKKDGNVLVVRGQKPPAGAFARVPAVSTSEPIAPGDFVLMVSDGVFRSSPIPARAEHFVVSRLRRMKDEPLEALVRSLSGHGQRLKGQEPADDVTVVAVRVDRV
jgi:hypothetical protein